MSNKSQLTNKLTDEILKLYTNDFLEQWQTCSCHWHLAKSLIELNKNNKKTTIEDFMIIESIKKIFLKKYPETQFHLWTINNLPENRKIKDMFWYLCMGDCPHILPILLEKLEEKNISSSGKNALKTLRPFVNIINPFYDLPELKITNKGIKLKNSNIKHKKTIENYIIKHMILLNESNT